MRRSGGVSSARELYPYSLKVRWLIQPGPFPLCLKSWARGVTKIWQLNSIDSMRVDGKFLIGSDIPEGQGSVSSLLAQCFDLAYELRVEAEEKDDESE